MKIDPQELQFEFKLTKKEEMPATMTLIIGQYQIKGFSIRKSKFESTKKVLFPPSNPIGKFWRKMFWTDKNDWKVLEELALKKFDDAEAGEYLKEWEEKQTDELPEPKIFFGKHK